MPSSDYGLWGHLLRQTDRAAVRFESPPGPRAAVHCRKIPIISLLSKSVESEMARTRGSNTTAASTSGAGATGTGAGTTGSRRGGRKPLIVPAAPLQPPASIAKAGAITKAKFMALPKMEEQVSQESRWLTWRAQVTASRAQVPLNALAPFIRTLRWLLHLAASLPTFLSASVSASALVC